MAKPSENTSRNETAALAGTVAMRHKTRNDGSSRTFGSGARYRSAPPGPGQQDWANHGSLRMKKPKGEIFLPAKP